MCVPLGDHAGPRSSAPGVFVNVANIAFLGGDREDFASRFEHGP